VCVLPLTKGYLKDPGEVAKLAIADGQQKKVDVVLVDTAGRMQNNDKLMRELAKLVQVFFKTHNGTHETHKT